MKRISYILSILFLSFTCFAQAQNNKVPVYSPEQILKKRPKGYWGTEVYYNLFNYTRYYLRLSEDYTAYDTSGNVISKGEFLKTLAAGGYLPLWLKSDDSLLYYKLYKLKTGTEAIYLDTFKGMGETYYEQYKREGEKFPDFSYTDLNGNVYSSENTKGKIVVFDCWFVACGRCVEEMPDLNKILKQYKNRKDIIFIGLDDDLKFNTLDFLKKTEFDFAVVPLPTDYFPSVLKVHAFPTTFVIDRKGYISKVVDRQWELADALKKEVAK